MSDNNDEKFSQACETGLSYCSTGKEAAVFLLGAIGLVTGAVIGSTVMLPIVAISAIIMGGVGVWLGIRKYKRNKQKQLAEELSAKAQEERNEKMVNIFQDIQRNIRDIKELEQLQHVTPQLVQDEKEINADEFFAANDSSFKNKPHFFAIETKDGDELMVVEVADSLPTIQNKGMK